MRKCINEINKNIELFMNVLFVDSYYPRFLSTVIDDLTIDRPDYSTLLNRINKLRFGTSDFYSRNFRMMGCQAEDIIFNCDYLQKKWWEENKKINKDNSKLITKLFKKLNFVSKNEINENLDLEDIAIEQIKEIKPEVLYLQDLNLFSPISLNRLRTDGIVKLIVGQIACPLPKKENINAFDLILTSFPHYVKKFRSEGINSEYFKIAFDPIVNMEIGDIKRSTECTFIGGISPAHTERLKFLERLASEVDMKFYGYGAESLSASSKIKPKHFGEVWGLDMYRELSRSAITINIHIDVAENNANNMRLYEATGSGALLITDMKDNLNELFKIDEEIITYKSVEEAVEKIKYFTNNPLEASKIAYAGQQRTLTEHTYQNRMIELHDILEKYLNKKN